MTNQYANSMAFMALVHFLTEVKGYTKEQAVAEAVEKIKAENRIEGSK